MVVTFPDGTGVMAHGRLEVVRPVRERNPDFALYLDERWGSDPSVHWPFTLISWEDFGLPADEAWFFEAVREVHRRVQFGEFAEIACDGGTGRTGTTLACLATLAGVPAEDAVRWVRENYHPWAVEVPEQEALVLRFAKGR